MNKKLTRLLKDYGFEVQGALLIQKGIRPYYSDTVFRRVRSLFDACETLIPLLEDDEFYNRFKEATS